MLDVLASYNTSNNSS